MASYYIAYIQCSVRFTDITTGPWTCSFMIIIRASFLFSVHTMLCALHRYYHWSLDLFIHDNNNGELLYSVHTMLCALHRYYHWSLDLFIHDNNNGELFYSVHTMLCALHRYYHWSLDLFIHDNNNGELFYSVHTMLFALHTYYHWSLDLFIHDNNNGELLYSVHTMLCALHRYHHWSLDLFIHVPFQLPFFKHTTLAAISALGTRRHLCPTRYSFTPESSEVCEGKCLAQGHNIEIMSQYWEGRIMIFLWKSCTKRDSKPHGRQWHWQSSALQRLRHVPLLLGHWFHFCGIITVHSSHGNVHAVQSEKTVSAYFINPMLFQCWPAVYDVSPTLKQHWVK